MANFGKIKINGYSYAFINVKNPKACVNYKFFDKQKDIVIFEKHLQSQCGLQLKKYIYTRNIAQCLKEWKDENSCKNINQIQYVLDFVFAISLIDKFIDML